MINTNIKHTSFSNYSNKHILLTLLLTLCLFAGFTLTATWTAQAQSEVNVYSYRQRQLVQPLFDAFTKSSGSKVNVVFASKGLIERLKQEGPRSPADVLLTADFGRMVQAADAGLLQPIRSLKLNRSVPRHLRHKDGLWYALTVRARVMVVSKDRVPSNSLKRYEDLALPTWKGRVCSRSGQHSYNVSLLASLIAHHGEKQALQWAKSVRGNLARKPQGNDRAQIKAIWQGLCDVALVNTYYLGLITKNPTQAPWGKAIKVMFPNQGDRGTHVNISGGGVTRHAPNRQQAIALLEFLGSPQAQELYAKANFEYPVNKQAPLSGFLQQLGKFKQDRLHIERVAAFRAQAVRLMDQAGWE